MKKQDQIQTIEFFTSKDHEIVNLLYAAGQVLDSYYWQSGVCYFVFEDKPKCEEIIANYYKGLVNLNAKDIFDAIKTIKGIILNR
jgi:hypothetical protein